MKKKILVLLLSASIAIGMIAFPMENMRLKAADYLSEEATENTMDNLEGAPVQLADNTRDWYWTVQEDGTASIEYYNGTATQIEIPSTLDGRDVTQIGWDVFRGNTTITSAVIPNTVKVIQ